MFPPRGGARRPRRSERSAERAVTACGPGPQRYRTSSGGFLRPLPAAGPPPPPPLRRRSERPAASCGPAARPAPGAPRRPGAAQAAPSPPPPADSALYLETSARRILLATGPRARPTGKAPPPGGVPAPRRPRQRRWAGAGGPAALRRPRSSRSALGPRLRSPKMGLNLCAALWERRGHAPAALTSWPGAAQGSPAGGGAGQRGVRGDGWDVAPRAEPPPPWGMVAPGRARARPEESAWPRRRAGERPLAAGPRWARGSRWSGAKAGKSSGARQR
ncbi:proline-rich protein 2-like [Pipra filicauda]|uniref:Proline-rich protein 2-like n=1 Tax=Pipra filicauda TaxID=649802 RepID=A0A7R5L5T2_9PASS|nr:proline-rich protein 2-like [Pipra filicauda]